MFLVSFVARITLSFFLLVASANGSLCPELALAAEGRRLYESMGLWEYQAVGRAEMEQKTRVTREGRGRGPRNLFSC